MAGKKEIRSKIQSTKNTQKITRAMEMVAASKMRKTQDRLKAARPYTLSMERIIFHIAQATPEYRHPYMVDRQGKNIGIIVISSDRGLCGGLNLNLFRKIFRKSYEWSQEGAQIHWGLIGKKACQFFTAIGSDVESKVENLGDLPTLEQIRGVILSMTKLYLNGEIDSIWVASNRFVNTMTQRPQLERLVPISDHELHALDSPREAVDAKIERASSWDYIYEPGPQEVLDELLDRYVEALVLHSLIENGASEMAARMVAMKNASENASRMIKELQLAYNKARQAAITQEIAEIVAGAAAV